MKDLKPFTLRRGYKKGPRGSISIGLNINIGQSDFPEGEKNPYIIIGDSFMPLYDDRLEKRDSQPGDPKISEP